MSGFKMIFLEKLLVFFNYILRANTSTGVWLQDFLEEVMGFLTITLVDQQLQQGAQAHCGYLCQRSYSTMGEARLGQSCVPADLDWF